MPIKIDIDMYTSTTFTPFSMSMPDGRLVTFGRPQVMGILNVTPDSFYGGSRSFDSIAIEQRVSTMLAEGVDIIDIGGYSSRPGATHVSEEEELRRLSLGMDIIRRHTTSIPFQSILSGQRLQGKLFLKWVRILSTTFQEGIWMKGCGM